MKCLEKDRARRYATANALAMDLQRHLKNEPVVARPPSRLYEFQKTVRRHKVAFAAAAAVIVALAAALLVSSLAAVRARRAELQTRYTGYVADMNLANRALQEGDLGMARTLLRRYWPGPNETDLRNWEWRYLAKLSDGEPHVSLVAHSTWVRSLRFLDDETLLTAGSADWRTILWNLEKQRPSKIITNLNSAGGVSEHMAVAPRRMLMFYRAQWGGTPRMAVVDLRSGREEPYREANRTRPDPDAPITSLDISRDQTSLCVAFGNRVALWDLDQNTWSQLFETESGAAIRGLFSPDGRVLVVADESGHIAFWNLAERRKLGVVTNTTGSQGLLSYPVNRELRFSADGQWLVNPSGRWPTKVWRVEDRKLVAELQDATVAELAVFSPDGRWLAMAGGDASIRLWEIRGWQKVRTLRGHTDRVVSMDFSPSGRYLASGARNGEVKLWSITEPPTAPDQISFPASEYHRIASDGSGFGRILRWPGTNGGVAAWTAEFWTSAPLQREFSVALPDGRPSSGVVLGGGRGIVLGGIDGSLRIFSSPLGEERVVSNAHGAEVYLMAVSMDGTTLATKGLRFDTREERVRIWRLPGLELIAELPRARNVHGIQLSDDGKLLAGFTGPGDMGVWEIPSMKGPPMWRGVEALQNVEVCAFSPDNRWLAAAPPDGSLYVWDLATRRRTVLPRALTSYLSLSFSPDGSRLAAGMSEEGKIFDTTSGQEVLSFHTAGLLAFARDSQRLLAVKGVAASALNAPPFAEVQFDWLNERPSGEIPLYRGPDPDYVRPDRHNP
jgi:WD40 repeat protein